MTKVIENNLVHAGNRLKIVFLHKTSTRIILCRLSGSDGIFSFSTQLAGDLPTESELSFDGANQGLKLQGLRVLIMHYWKETQSIVGTKEKLRAFTRGLLAGNISDGTSMAKKFYMEHAMANVTKEELMQLFIDGVDTKVLCEFYYNLVVAEAKKLGDPMLEQKAPVAKKERKHRPLRKYNNPKLSYVPNVTFITRENRVLQKKEERAIYCRIFYAGKVREFSTGIKVLPDQFYNGTILINSEAGAEYQRTLDLIKTEILSIYNNRRASELDISAEILQKEYTGKATRKPRVETEGFLLQANLFLDTKRKLVGKDFGPKQYQRYELRIDLFKKFIQFDLKQNDLPISAIREATINDFYVYCRSNLNHSKAYIRKTIQTIKAVIDFAVLNDVADKNYIKNFRVKLDGNTAIKHLTLEQVIVLKNTNFADQTLSFVRDAFLFQCFTGLSYSEASRFSMQHIEQGDQGELWIKMDRNKTGNTSVIPVFSETMELVNKYKDLSHKAYAWFDNPGLMPFFDNATMNKILKQVGLVCNIPVELMCTHTARKTFAMIMINRKGVSLESVAQMLGHSETRTTNKFYAAASRIRLKAEVQQTSFLSN